MEKFQGIHEKRLDLRTTDSIRVLADFCLVFVVVWTLHWLVPFALLAIASCGTLNNTTNHLIENRKSIGNAR